MEAAIKNQAKAMVRQVRISPTKVRQVLVLIRGKKSRGCYDNFAFQPEKGCAHRF